MSTIDHLPAVSGGSATVHGLDAVRARRRRDHLLDLRGRLTALAAERLSHGVDDAMETYEQQLAVEYAIVQEFPDVHAERFPTWVQRDLALEHDPDRLQPTCGICQAVARRSGGVNLTPPEAA